MSGKAVEIKSNDKNYATTEVTSFSWRNDDEALHEYFLACVMNWKEYGGARTAKQVLKIQTMYKQAVFGDNNKPPPENLKSIEAVKWLEWEKYKGVTKQMAKRRFITLLAGIDPLLIDILPAEKPPEGFPVDFKSKTVICAKCNTTTGCIRPLVNAQKVDLRTQLFECEELHEAQNLRVWLVDALEHQRCVWGVHKPVFPAQAKEHTAWFNRNENKGFLAYDTSKTIMGFIKELVHSYHEAAHEMMLHKEDYDAEGYNIQATKVFKLKEVYEALSSEEFVYEVACERDVAVCNRRREMDRGHNHMHPFEIDKPVKIDTASYDDALALRKQCQALGLACSTGKVETIQQRCDIYRARIEEHYKNVKISEAAKARNDDRLEIHRAERRKVVNMALDTIVKQCKAACEINDATKVATLVRRGCPPDTESNRGISPLICSIINAAPSEALEGILAKKANPNLVSQMGYTALILAARLRDLKAIHVIMHSGGVALQNTGRRGRGWTVLHHCAVHSCEEELRVIVDYVKEGGGDILRVTRFLDWQNMDGDSALMLAAKKRNGLMCRILTTLGANPNLRNNQGRNACYLARQAGWAELSDWLEKKVGSGVAKLETYSDLQYDKALRYGTVKIRDALESFGKEYTKTVLGYLTRCPLVCPSAVKLYESEKETMGLREHQRFMDLHHIHVLEREQEFKFRSDITDTERVIAEEGRKKLKEVIAFMVAEVRKGTTNPNAEYTGNPLPWTPLMCAAALNDVRSIRLLVREGGDPNHPNKLGITALMVAAQLHNAEALVELLIFGGEMAQVDNEGFNAMAYATSLPLAQNMAHSASGTITGPDVEGAKRLNSMDIFMLSHSAGGKGGTQAELLKQTLAQNLVDVSGEMQQRHFKFLRLLENHGLSRMETIPQIIKLAEATTWRMSGTVTLFDRSLLNLDDVETTSERDERELLEQHQRDREAAEKMKEADPNFNWEGLRCPMCTLLVPCNHFFKVSSLKEYLAKIAAGQKIKLATATGHNVKKRGIKMVQHKHNVLEIAGLHDRQMDRSLNTMKGYRERDWDLALEGRHLKKLAEAKRTKEALRAEAIANGTWEEWKRHYDVHGVMHFHNVDTGEEWFECFDAASQKSYYYNPETTESSWIAPPDMPTRPAGAAAGAGVGAGIAFEDDTVRGKAPSKPMLPGGASISIDPSDTGASDTKEALSTVAQTTVALKPVEVTKPLKGVLKKHDPKKILAERLAKLKMDPGAPSQRHIKFRFEDENGENAVIVDHNGVEVEAAAAVVAAAAETTTGETEGKDDSTLVTTGAGNVSRLGSPERTRITSPGGTKHGIGDDGDSIGSFRNMLEIGMAAKTKELNELSKKVQVLDMLPPNPVPPESRSMFMFTQEFMDRGNLTDGLFAAKMRKPAKAVDASQVNSLLNAAGGDSSDGEESSTSAPPPMLQQCAASFSGLKYAKNIAKAAGKAVVTDVKVSKAVNPLTVAPVETDDDYGNVIPEIRLSGWVFVSLSSLQAGHSPVDTLTLSLENWGMILEHLRETFLHKWVPEMNITSLPHIISWKIDAPRCKICNIGYCRWKKPMEVLPEDRLCLTCLVRRELYEKVKQVLPRSFRKKVISSWPFLDSNPSPVCSAPATPSGSRRGSPTKQASKLELSTSKSERGLGRQESLTLPALSVPRRHNSMTPERKPYEIVNNNPVFSPGKSDVSITMSAELQALDEAERAYDEAHPEAILRPVATVNPWRKRRENDGDEEHDTAATSTSKSRGKMGTTGRTRSPDRPGSSAGRPAPSAGRPGSQGKPKSRERERSRELRKKKDKKAKKNYEKSSGFGMIEDDSSDDEVVVSRGSRRGASRGNNLMIQLPDGFNREEKLMKKEGPAELTMLSYLIAKGHFEETERISRLCIRNEAIPLFNEGQGVSYLVKLFHTLGEMYKLMGLWVLALGLYMDSTDMIVSLLGYEDSYSIESLGFSTNCLRKMHLPVLAKSYVSHITKQIETLARNKSKAALGRKILDAEREHVKLQLKSDDIWHILKTEMPTQDNKKKAYFIHGMGSLFNLMVASEGYAIVAKSLFMAHCIEVDPRGMGKFAEFASYCFRLRVSDCEEVFGHLVRHLLQKQLNPNHIETSELAALWNSSVSNEIKTAVDNYVNRGIPVHANIFDSILRCAMIALTPEYRRFFYSEKGTILRKHYMDADVEAAEVNATVIQSALRMKIANKVKGKLLSKLTKVKEAKAAHDSHMKNEYTRGPHSRGSNTPDMTKLGLFSPGGTAAGKTNSPIKTRPEFW